MAPSPHLSVCIPTYNRARRLNLLLHSLAEQIQAGVLGDQVEVVISDNASTDETCKVGEKWAFRHSFIRYFRNPSNIGGEPNFVRAIERATGRFAWVFGDDDRIRELGLIKVLSYLKPGVTQLYLNFRCISPQGDCLINSRLSLGIPAEITTKELVKRIGFVSAYALISSHVFDREILLAANPAALLRVSPYYVLNAALLAAFHNQVCQVVQEPLLDYTVDNERLPSESALYVRVLGLLSTLRWLELSGAIDTDFLYGCCETGAAAHLPSIFLREELYGNLMELSGFWALPAGSDLRLVRDFIERGPGFWGQRHYLKKFFNDTSDDYLKHQRPTIFHWRGKAWVPSFSILLASDEKNECDLFDQWLTRWPAEFAHESLLVSRLPETGVSVEHVDVHLAPFREHRSPSAALNTGLRKTLAKDVLILNQVCSASIKGMIEKIETWRMEGNAPASCLLFTAAGSGATSRPMELLGLFTRRTDLVHLGGFENRFKSWSRQRLLADAGLRLDAEGWAVEDGFIDRELLSRWFAEQLPVWVRTLRHWRKKPLSEHGLNISLRSHLKRVEAQQPS